MRRVYKIQNTALICMQLFILHIKKESIVCFEPTNSGIKI